MWLVNPFVTSHNCHFVVFVAKLHLQTTGRSHPEGKFHTAILRADWEMATGGRDKNQVHYQTNLLALCLPHAVIVWCFPVWLTVALDMKALRIKISTCSFPGTLKTGKLGRLRLTS